MWGIAAVEDGVVPSPVGFAIGSCQAVGGFASGVIVAVQGVCRPWGVADCAASPSACAPPKQVYPTGIVLAGAGVRVA